MHSSDDGLVDHSILCEDRSPTALEPKTDPSHDVAEFERMIRPTN
jgi:hypothetical protein